MKQYYGDIIEAAGKKPLWWEENGVPRFSEFDPQNVSDIYADEAALVEIACQLCGEKFKVAITSNSDRRFKSHAEYIGMRVIVSTSKGEMLDIKELAEKFPADSFKVSKMIKEGRLFYKDPPNVDCCRGGSSMTSMMLEVVEYWSKRERSYTWERNSDMEVALQDKPFITAAEMFGNQ